MSQCDQILDYIRRRGFISPAIAYEDFGCLALHSRAAELRAKGYDVVCTIRTGNGRKWGEYTLRQRELAL